MQRSCFNYQKDESIDSINSGDQDNSFDEDNSEFKGDIFWAVFDQEEANLWWLPWSSFGDIDHRGNTPLTLAGKLCGVDEEYLKIVQILLDKGMKVK